MTRSATEVSNWKKTLANMTAGMILAVGQTVYALFRLVFNILTGIAKML